jgi:hypothetical protein
MKRSTRIALATAAAVAAGGVIAATAHADGRWEGGAGYHQAKAEFGGDKGGKRMMKMFETFDANGDGALTQEEIDTYRSARLAEFDANGDKVLTLEEYQALWLDAMHERMVDGFQRLDADGDGQVTGTEFNAPFARLVARADRNDDGKLDASDRPERGKGKHDRHDDDDKDTD